MLPAILIGAGIGAAGNLIGNAISADAQRDVARMYSEAAERQRKEYQNAYDQSFGAGSYNEKIKDMGLDATIAYNGLINNPAMWNEWLTGGHAYQAPEAFNFTADDLTDDPSYKWRLQQGLDAMQQSQVAGGLNLSGAAAKQINDWAQNEASKEYAAAYGRANDQYNKDRQFDFNEWLTNANQFYNNLNSQLAGLGNVSAQGSAANSAQAQALSGMANANATTIGQVAGANANAQMAGAGVGQNLAQSVGNIIGYGVANMGTAGDQAGSVTQVPMAGTTQYGSGNITQQDVSNFMAGINPYMQNQYI